MPRQTVHYDALRCHCNPAKGQVRAFFSSIGPNALAGRSEVLRARMLTSVQGNSVIVISAAWKTVMRFLIDGLLCSIGALIYYAGLDRLIIHLNRRSPKVLMYHACEPFESEFIRGLSINTTPVRLAAHLGYLSSRYRVVPLADLFKSGALEPTVAITFDDGFRSVHDNAWPLLRERQIPATCYLTTGVIGNDTLIWLNELNWFLHRHPQLAVESISARLGLGSTSSGAVIRRALIERYDSRMIEDLLGDLRAKAGVDGRTLARTSRLFLDWEQVAAMSNAGVQFGNHTCSHPNLLRIDQDTCRAEIAAGQRALARLSGASASLAYPFGSRSEETRQIALELGTRSMLEVEGVNDPFDPTRIGRIKLSSDSVPVLFARMEIMEPVKGLLKRLRRSDSRHR
jgi:peptidoglycan/xylan/chitin deacetylase (PgdA/CDA1 family)